MRFGAPFARVIMAISMSTVMTSTVVGPMAFQAHTARSVKPDAELVVPDQSPRSEVLSRTSTREYPSGPGSTSEISTTEPGPSNTVPPTGAASEQDDAASGLFYAAVTSSPGEAPVPAKALDGSVLTEASYIIVSLPDIADVDFFVDGKAAALAALPPWNLYLGTHLDPAKLGAGSHTVRAEVTTASGVTTTYRATFTTLRR